MLVRAISTQKTSELGNRPRHLQSKSSTLNAPKGIEPSKRKFDRTISSTSSLSALHEQVFFDENNLDGVIDLTITPPSRKKDIQYSNLESVEYPILPPLAQNEKTPSSSAAVPWSSSPPSHFRAPSQSQSQSFDSNRQKKRRKLPWANTVGEDEVSKSEVDRSKDSFAPSKYAWNKSARDVMDEQKEFRRRNKIKAPLATASKAPNPGDKLLSTMLSQEQKNVMASVVDEGKSIFFTGSAGTGKSVLMRSIIARFRDKFRREPDRLAVTASTGLAACVIEGNTLHSWAGIGLGKEPAPELVKKIKRNPKSKVKWLRTKVLIIDEISMVDGELFDKLEQVARSIRNNGMPFGGIQLVITGDFFQLPPVPERNSIAKFAFDASTWNTCIEHTILLTHVFRQKDPVFANMLNEMRLGKLSSSSIRAFQGLSRPLEFQDEVEATELFPTRIEVDNANTSRMQNLSGQVMTFTAVDSGVSDLSVRNKVLANFMAPEKLSLKKGAQVMLIKNIDSQLVNGSLGKVHSFMDVHTFTVYKDDEETFLLAQEPEGGVDAEEKAAARKKISSMRLKNGNEGAIRYWPMVRFALPDGTSRDMLCQPEEWKTENQQGEITAKREQIPLILAWALSIHKAQGQTLNRVKVDLGKVFERGQAYVALSRATSQAGLQVLRFDQKKVMVHPKVIQFYNKLGNSNSLLKDVSKGGVLGTEYEERFVNDVDDEELDYLYGN